MNTNGKARKHRFAMFIPECLTPMFRTFDPHVDKYGIKPGLR